MVGSHYHSKYVLGMKQEGLGDASWQLASAVDTQARPCSNAHLSFKLIADTSYVFYLFLRIYFDIINVERQKDSFNCGAYAL